jgi:hypothetical protein
VNKSFLRANVDKYIPFAKTPAYLHTDTPEREAGNVNGDPEAVADTPDRAVEGGTDATASGYCQVCHTNTNYHRSSNTSTMPAPDEGDARCHDGFGNDSCGENGIGNAPTLNPAFQTHCGDCHRHDNTFQGEGGLTSCTSCHASTQGTNPSPPPDELRPIITTQFDRASSHITSGSGAVTQPDCLVCHDQSKHKLPEDPDGQKIRLYDADDNANSFVQPTKAAAPLSEGSAFEGHCLSCHEDGSADSLPPFAGDTAGQTDTSPFSGSGSPPIVDENAWPTSGHDGGGISCVGDGVNGCHGSGHGSVQTALLADAVEGSTLQTVEEFCLSCHDGSVATLNIPAEFASLAAVPNVDPVDSQSGAVGLDNYHDLAVVSCPDCHSPHVDNVNAVTPQIGDPDTGLPVAYYQATGPGASYTEDGANLTYYNTLADLDPVNPEGSGGGFTEPDYIQFCLACHDGTTPAGVTMTANMTNIAFAYSADAANSQDVHGGGAAAGQGGSTNKGGMKVPWVTAADAATNNDPTGAYAAMNCNTCHGAHGTGNIYNLRTSITVAGVQMSVGGVGANASNYDPARTPDPTVYTLPPLTGGGKKTLDPVNGVQTDHYWGAWCTFCHKKDAHPGKVETDVCTNGHMHGGGAF